MVIAIKSEMDSRVVLYPLMKACSIYGSVLVMTSNRYVRRVIDDQEYSTFKNIAVLVDETVQLTKSVRHIRLLWMNMTIS